MISDSFIDFKPFSVKYFRAYETLRVLDLFPDLFYLSLPVSPFFFFSLLFIYLHLTLRSKETAFVSILVHTARWGAKEHAG